MQLKKYITVLASALLLFACAKEEFDTPTSTPDGPVTVGFWVGRGDTRAETPNAGFELDAPLGAETTRTHASSFDNSIGNGKLSVSWSNGDQVAMWAKPQNGTDYTFSNQTFKNWFVSADSQNAYFTTTLDEGEAMTADLYNYYICYPTPASANGTTATFTIPSTQDGKMGGRADIMMAQGSGIALQSLDSDGDFVIDKPKDYPSFTMKHLIHSLMFYVPAGNNWGFPADETIERIVFTMPSTASGTVTANATAYSTNNDGTITTPALALQTAGSNTIALNLTDPIGPSSGNDLDFAAAAIIPPSTTFGEGDNITIKVYTQTKAASQTISLNGRGSEAQYDNMRMAANRVTPVVLNCSNAVDQYVLRFKLGKNNLGEDVNTIIFKNSSGTEIYRIENVEENLKKPGFHDIDFTFAEDKTPLTSLAGQPITAEYDSAHALVKNTFTMPPVNTPGRHEVELTVPYLFFEDFGTITTYEKNYLDGPHTSVKGASSTAYDLADYGIPGWTGARTAGEAGKAILVAGRADEVKVIGYGGTTRAYGRLDSPAMTNLKPNASVKIKVSFNYGGGRDKENTFTPIGAFGYTTMQGKINGYATQYVDETRFSNISGHTEIDDIEFTGSFNDIPQSGTYTIDNCNSSYRLSWHMVVMGGAGIANACHFLYLDNIKVQIVP